MPAEVRTLSHPDSLLAWVEAHPGQASLVVADAGGRVRAVAPDAPRPLAALDRLVTLSVYARQAAVGLDTAAAVPGAKLERRLLPREDPGGAPAGRSVAGLARAAFAESVAADELLDLVGRGNVEAEADRLGLDPPLPWGGLRLAWAPEVPWAWPTRDAQARAFATLPDAARRDSVLARARLYLNSDRYRSAERRRLERGGLGLSPAVRDSVAQATLPRGSAAAVAALLRRLGLGDGADAEAFRDALGMADGVAVVGGREGGVVSVAGLSRESGRSVALLFSGLPEPLARHLRETRLDAALVRRLLQREG